AFARDEAVAEANKFEQALLPRVHANFDVDPRIRFGCGEKFGGDAVGFSAAFFRAARQRSHHAAIASAADSESCAGERAAELTRIFVVRLAFARTRAAEDGDDFFCNFWRGSHGLTVPLRPPQRFSGRASSEPAGLLRACCRTLRSSRRKVRRA